MSRLQKKALIGANMADPRIGILAVDERGNEDTALENIIIAGLQEQGFSRLIDLTQIEASVRRRILNAEMNYDEQLKKMLMSQFHVDYMVTAKISRTNSGIGNTKIHVPDDNSPVNDIPLEVFFPKVTGLKRSHVDISARMLNVNTGEIIFAGVSAGDGTGRDAPQEAMQNATRDLIGNLSDAAINKAANPEQHLTIIVTGGKLGSVGQTYRRLSEIPGVSHVFTRAADAFGNIQADVDYYGTAYDLAEEMERIGIKISEMTSEYIKI